MSNPSMYIDSNDEGEDDEIEADAVEEEEHPMVVEACMRRGGRWKDSHTYSTSTATFEFDHPRCGPILGIRDEPDALAKNVYTFSSFLMEIPKFPKPPSQKKNFKF